MSIQEEAKRLEDLLAQQVNAWRKDLEDIKEEIKQLDATLQEKEAKTDRSENATFQIAKDTRDLKMGVATTISKKIDLYSSHENTYVPTGVITVGSTVEVRPLTVNGVSDSDPRGHRVIKLVEAGLSDAMNLVGIDSVVGAALLGHREGETITVRTRKGIVTYVIERMH